MIARLFAIFMVLSYVTPSLVADEVIRQGVKAKLHRNSIQISELKVIDQPVVTKKFNGEKSPRSGKESHKVPVQTFTFPSSRQKSQVRSSIGYAPDFQYRCPRAWSALRREINRSAEYDRRQSRKQNQLPLHGGALISRASQKQP
ncbi:hypothetical protein Pan161_46470 [Gimesia algae]|uniref:Uncharacterized protein n=2 Tax=Gimesia algae TaxID=2527971 RepID=A0A517VJ00_9PLAN|nr:hypothetical protein Pan161_46470 [Gimesia algae]